MVRIRGCRGFTMTEALMVVAILGIISGMGAAMLLQVNRFFIMSRAKLDLQREARATMYLITRALRQAQASTIVLDRHSSSQPFYSKITFTKVDGDSLVFRQDGTALQMVDGVNVRTLSNNLKYLAFTFPRSDEMTIISVSMTLQTSTYEGRVKALHMASEKVQVMNE